MKMNVLVVLSLLPFSAAAQWEVRMNGLPPNVTFQNVAATAPTTAWVASGVKLWKSEDLGHSWIPVTIPSQHGNPLVISAIDPQVVMYCSHTGKVVRSTDGGSSWAKVFDDSTVTTFFNDLDMLDSLQGYAIGDPPDASSGPGLIWTTDGGASWEIVPNNLPVGDIQVRDRTDFVSTLKGWTKGYNDGIYRTTNGGHNWERIYDGLDASNLFFVNDSVGFYTTFVSPTGLFKTTDGGFTWKQTFYGGPFIWVRWAKGGKLLWAARDTLYVSSDLGESWQSVLSNRGMGG